MTAFHRYPFSREQLIKEYQEGRSIAMLARQYGMYPSNMRYVMKIWKIPTRKSTTWHSRLFEQKNPRWKGNRVSQQTFHQRVYTVYGAPKECSMCGTIDKEKIYDWANTNGDYTNRSNFRRMCRSCHHRYDFQRGQYPTKLTADIVRHMRQEYTQGHITQFQLAKRYGVDQSAISNAIRGRNWSHVT